MTLALNCVRCGNSNFNYAQFCAACGGHLNWGQQHVGPTPATGNGRAMVALVLGIAGLLFCGFTAIPGAILAWIEMQAVREGRAPQANGTMAKIAFWLNAAVLVLTALAVVLMMFFSIALI
jgi:uncharacterized membrane protein